MQTWSCVVQVDEGEVGDGDEDEMKMLCWKMMRASTIRA